MDQQEPPFMRPTSRCMIYTLPAELLHSIVKVLEVEDKLALRKTCSLLAQIGADHILNTVGLYYLREKFEQLRQIAKHPVFSKKVRALYFQGDRLADHELLELHCDYSACEWDDEFFEWDDDFEEWYEKRTQSTDMSRLIGRDDSARFKRMFATAIKRYLEGQQDPKNACKEMYLDEACDRYRALLEAQDALSCANVEGNALHALFSR